MTTDHSLLIRFVTDHHPAAFDELVTRHAGMVYATARRICGDEAGDVTQAVFVTLFRKAASLGDQMNLAGWLYETARLTALNSRRVANRRTAHERTAAMQHAEASDPESQSDPAILEEVDDVLRQLPRNFRDAVLLRYLEGRSTDEVAAMLGVSIAAAGKRATRGLERMRTMLARRGLVVPVAGLTAVLMWQHATVAPAMVLSGLSATSIAASGASATAVTAKITVIGWNAIAAAILFLSVGIVGTVIWMEDHPTVAPMTGAPVVAVSTGITPPPPVDPNPVLSPVDEAKIDGVSCLARFTTLVDSTVIPSLNTKTTAVPGQPLRRGTAADVFNVLRAADSSQEIFQFDSSMSHDTAVIAAVKGEIYIPQFWKDFRLDGLEFTAGFTASKNIHARDVGGGAFEVSLVDPGIEAFIEEYSHEPREVHTTKLAVDWKGAIAPGEAVVLTHDYSPIRDRHFSIVSVYHVYRGTNAELDRVRGIRDGAKWIEVGPDGGRALAARAIKWAGGRKVEPKDVPPVWTKKLDNGVTVKLLAIGRPATLPFCWWDAEGQPIDRDWTNLGVQLDARKAVVIARDWLDASTNTSMVLDDAFAIPDADRSVDAWIGNGPWIEQEIRVKDTVEISDGTVTFKQRMKGTTELAVMRGDLGPDVELYVDAITTTGERIKPNRDASIQLVTSESKRWTREDENLWVDQKKIDKFILRWRLRQKVTFGGFADVPVSAP